MTDTRRTPRRGGRSQIGTVARSKPLRMREGTMTETVEVRCDGWCDNANTVTHLDEKGYAYCTPCGVRRRSSGIRCRKMTAKELRAIQSGEQIERY